MTEKDLKFIDSVTAYLDFLARMYDLIEGQLTHLKDIPSSNQDCINEKIDFINDKIYLVDKYWDNL